MLEHDDFVDVVATQVIPLAAIPVVHQAVFRCEIGYNRSEAVKFFTGLIVDRSRSNSDQVFLGPGRGCQKLLRPLAVSEPCHGVLANEIAVCIL